jgi:hypothetical protein
MAPTARRGWLVIEQAILEALNEDRAPTRAIMRSPALPKGAPVALDLPNLHIGDFRELAYVIDDSVEMVFTDPPSPPAKPAVPFSAGTRAKQAYHTGPGGRIPPRVRAKCHRLRG